MHVGFALRFMHNICVLCCLFVSCLYHFFLLSTFVVLPFSRQFTHHFSSNCLQSSYFFPIKPDINFGMVHFKTKPKYRRRGDIQRKAHVYDNTHSDHEAIINSSWFESFFLSFPLYFHCVCGFSWMFFLFFFKIKRRVIWTMSYFRYHEKIFNFPHTELITCWLLLYCIYQRQ